MQSTAGHFADTKQPAKESTFSHSIANASPFNSNQSGTGSHGLPG